MAPAIMGNPDRPELGEELTNSFCRTDPKIAREFARVTFSSDNRADLGRVAVPSLIMQCSDDIIASTQVGEYVHHHIPGSEIVYLDAAWPLPELERAAGGCLRDPRLRMKAVFPSTPGSFEDLEDLFENAPCGYLSLHPDGRIMRSNRTFSTWIGIPPEQLVGKRLRDLLNVAGRMFYETHFAPLLRMQGFFNEVALDVVTANGKTLPMLVNARERRDPDGNLVFTRVTLFAAAERRRYERELVEAEAAAEAARLQLAMLNEELEKRVSEVVAQRLAAELGLTETEVSLTEERATAELREQFIAVLGHDLRNPVAAINAATRILLQSRRANGQRRSSP